MTDINKAYDLGLLDDHLNVFDHLKIRWARSRNASLDLRLKYVAGVIGYQEFERLMERVHNEPL